MNDPAAGAGEVMVEVRDLAKTFTLHTQNGIRIPVFEGVRFDVTRGECVVLSGPSGSGKSTLLRSLYANYRPSSGVGAHPPRRGVGGHRHRGSAAWSSTCASVPSGT